MNLSLVVVVVECRSSPRSAQGRLWNPCGSLFHEDKLKAAVDSVPRVADIFHYSQINFKCRQNVISCEDKALLFSSSQD